MKEIPLTQGKVALVDDADYPALSAHKWYYLQAKPGFGYAVRKVGLGGRLQRLVYLHREILAADATGLWVDHRNGDTLDNTRANIRLCTPLENARNKRCHREAAAAAGAA